MYVGLGAAGWPRLAPASSSLTRIPFSVILEPDTPWHTGTEGRGEKSTMTDPQSPTVKIFYDHQGLPREVLLSYETYREMLSSIREMAAETEQAYFWTEHWQAMERAADEAAAAGHSHTFESIDEMIEFLDAQ